MAEDKLPLLAAFVINKLSHVTAANLSDLLGLNVTQTISGRGYLDVLVFHGTQSGSSDYRWACLIKFSAYLIPHARNLIWPLNHFQIKSYVFEYHKPHYSGCSTVAALRSLLYGGCSTVAALWWLLYGAALQWLLYGGCSTVSVLRLLLYSGCVKPLYSSHSTVAV